MKTFFFLFLCTASVAVSQPSWHRKGDQAPMTRRHKMMEELNLTDEQQQQIRKLRSVLMKEQIGLRATVQTLRLDLGDLFAESRPDKSKIDAKVTEIGRVQ